MRTSVALVEVGRGGLITPHLLFVIDIYSPSHPSPARRCPSPARHPRGLVLMAGLWSKRAPVKPMAPLCHLTD